jgi:hypothetical protein
VVAPGKLRSLEELSHDKLDDYAAHANNLEFGELYKHFTGGSEWLSMYRRDPPKHQIWRADCFGQQHVVQTQETKFIELPSSKELHSLSISEMRRDGKKFMVIGILGSEVPYNMVPWYPDG